MGASSHCVGFTSSGSQRHEDIVENEQSVGLVEIHRKRMVECRTTAVAVRFPANQLHTRGIEGQTEDRGGPRRRA